MADEVHEVGGILAVVDGEGRFEPDLQRIVAQQPRADAVEGAGPGQRIGDHRRVAAEHLAGNALDAFGHLCRGAAREGHQQDAARIGAPDDQVRDAVGQRVGLAGPGAGDDQQRSANTAVAMHDRQALLGIELAEIGRLEARIMRGKVHRGMKHCFRFVRNAFAAFACATARAAAGVFQ